MGDVQGFLKHGRELPARRPVPVRIKDWKEVYEPFGEEKLQTQASRCMDCGIPFCNNGCPLGNLIPDWNDLVFRDRWQEAIERLHATNNFPEFTGRLCPAPCEAACVLGINQDPVTIKQVEVSIIDRAWEEGWVTPLRPSQETGKSVAVIGSGPAGLAAAQQLTRAGHHVVVYERADRIGGLLRYGIPEFKMEKRHLDRRIAQMRAEGTVFLSLADGDKPAGIVVATRLRELGLGIATTRCTGEYLSKFGIVVDQVVGKVSDGHGINAVQLIESGQIAFVINTPQGRGGRTDGEQIRKSANSHHVSSVTTVEAALAAVHGMAEMVGHEISVRPLQEYHS